MEYDYTPESGSITSSDTSVPLCFKDLGFAFKKQKP